MLRNRPAAEAARLGEREYGVVYGVTRAVIDHLYAGLSAHDGTSGWAANGS
jgi:hypothetical protein